MKRLLPALALLVSFAIGVCHAATPLLLYKFNEGSGTTATDTSTGTAASGTITPGASGAWDTSLGANKTGYNFNGTGTGTTASLSGTKVQTALTSTTKLTLELVFDSAASTSTYDEFLKLSDGSGTGLVGATINHSQGGLIFSAGEGAFPNDCLIKYAIPTSGVIVLHVVIDSTQATAANRVLVYVAGSAVTPSIIDQLGLNATLDTTFNWSTSVLFFGEAGASPRKLYYAAIYSVALTSGQVSANATALAANNDADPNGTVTPTDNAIFMFAGEPGMDSALPALAWSAPPRIVPEARPAPIEVIDAALPWWAIRSVMVASTSGTGGTSGAGGATGKQATYEEYRRAHCRRFPDLCQ